jgi:hypothetical protein
MTDLVTARPIGCRSDAEIGEIFDGIVVRGAGWEGGELKAGGATGLFETSGKNERRELITAVRAGQHVELTVKARTYRQKKGQPNRRFLRFAVDQLDAIAKSFVGMPFLVDHNTSEMTARKGTILTSELIADSRGMSAFDMTFSVVKPEAVISILDGTLDRFSIGWFPTGPVNCSVHRTDVRGPNACSCWPGDEVAVDGKTQIVEYEFQSAEGKELSGVNVPAVRGTRIDDVRAALSAELSLPTKRERVMPFSRLAQVLGLTALTEADEDRAVSIYENLTRGKLAAEQERDRAIAADREKSVALAAVTASAGKQRIDTLIAGAYTSGKLRYQRDDAGAALPSKREARLRALAARDGIDALAVEIEELEVSVPVGERQLSAAVAEPERTPTGAAAPADNPYLAVAARELGIPLEQLQANAREFGNGT